MGEGNTLEKKCWKCKVRLPALHQSLIQFIGLFYTQNLIIHGYDEKLRSVNVAFSHATFPCAVTLHPMSSSPSPDPALLPFLSELLHKNFQTETREQAPYQWLWENLKIKLEELINHDMERLVQLMYRIDIEESDFHRAMGEPQPAEALAHVVMKRFLRKALLRKRFS